MNELSGVYLDFLPIYGAIGDDTILYPLILSIRNYTSRFISFDTLHLVKSVLSAKMRPYCFRIGLLHVFSLRCFYLWIKYSIWGNRGKGNLYF